MKLHGEATHYKNSLAGIYYKQGKRKGKPYWTKGQLAIWLVGNKWWVGELNYLGQSRGYMHVTGKSCPATLSGGSWYYYNGQTWTTGNDLVSVLEGKEINWVTSHGKESQRLETIIIQKLGLVKRQWQKKQISLIILSPVGSKDIFEKYGPQATQATHYEEQVPAMGLSSSS